ncbi:MAG: hypothetical protein GF364_04970, partial [Candidatus Lokiarchaeota archaeon]|nr:hypothetical protein [Candidatus Lokiarchaeota archaeon]
MKNEIEKNLKNRDVKSAEENNEKLRELSKESPKETTIKNTDFYCNEVDVRIEKIKEIMDLETELDENLEKAEEFIENKDFDDTIDLLNKSLEKAEEKKMEDYVERIKQEVERAERLKDKKENMEKIQKSIEESLNSAEEELESGDYNRTIEILEECQEQADIYEITDYNEKISDLLEQAQQMKKDNELIEKIEGEIEHEIESMNSDLDENNYTKPEKQLKSTKKKIKKHKITGYSKEIKKIEKRIKEQKELEQELNEIKNKIEHNLEEADNLIDEKEYEAALKLLDKTEDLANDNDLDEYESEINKRRKKINELQEERKKIEDKKKRQKAKKKKTKTYKRRKRPLKKSPYFSYAPLRRLMKREQA